MPEDKQVKNKPKKVRHKTKPIKNKVEKARSKAKPTREKQSKTKPKAKPTKKKLRKTQLKEVKTKAQNKKYSTKHKPHNVPSPPTKARKPKIPSSKPPTDNHHPRGTAIWLVKVPVSRNVDAGTCPKGSHSLPSSRKAVTNREGPSTKHMTKLDRKTASQGKVSNRKVSKTLILRASMLKSAKLLRPQKNKDPQR